MLRREAGHVLRRLLDIQVDGQWKKGKQKRMWKKRVEEESGNVTLSRECAL